MREIYSTIYSDGGVGYWVEEYGRVVDIEQSMIEARCACLRRSVTSMGPPADREVDRNYRGWAE